MSAQAGWLSGPDAVDSPASLVDDWVEGASAGVQGRDEDQTAAQLRDILHVQRRGWSRHLDRMQLKHTGQGSLCRNCGPIPWPFKELIKRARNVSMVASFYLF